MNCELKHKDSAWEWLELNKYISGPTRSAKYLNIIQFGLKRKFSFSISAELFRDFRFAIAKLKIFSLYLWQFMDFCRANFEQFYNFRKFCMLNC